MIKYLPQIKIW